MIVFIGEASIDLNCPPALKIPAYFEKYMDGIASLDMTPEEFSEEYSIAIKNQATQIRGWE